MNFFQNTSHFHTNWLIFEGLGYPKPNSKIFWIWFTGTKTYFLRPQAKLPRKFDPPYCISQGSLQYTLWNLSEYQTRKYYTIDFWITCKITRGSANQKYFNKVLYRTPANPQQLITDYAIVGLNFIFSKTKMLFWFILFEF
jgi:hypothetical protein